MQISAQLAESLGLPDAEVLRTIDPGEVSASIFFQ